MPSMHDLVRASQGMLDLGWSNASPDGILGLPLIVTRNDILGWYNQPTNQRAFVVDIADTSAVIEDRKGNPWPAWKLLVQVIGAADPPSEVVALAVHPRAYSGMSGQMKMERCPIVTQVAWQMKRMPDDTNFPVDTVAPWDVLSGPAIEKTDPRLMAVQLEAPGGYWSGGWWGKGTWVPLTPSLHRVLPLAQDNGDFLVVKYTYQSIYGKVVPQYGWVCPIPKLGDKYPVLVSLETPGRFDDYVIP